MWFVGENNHFIVTFGEYYIEVKFFIVKVLYNLYPLNDYFFLHLSEIWDVLLLRWFCFVEVLLLYCYNFSHSSLRALYQLKVQSRILRKFFIIKLSPWGWHKIVTQKRQCNSQFKDKRPKYFYSIICYYLFSNKTKTFSVSYFCSHLFSKQH